MGDYRVVNMIANKHKIIGQLPAKLEPNAEYYVRTATGFDLYVADSTGQMAHKINDNIEFMKKYVQSRGTGLITNGTGLLMDNTNFSKFVFDRTDAKAGFGCFTTDIRNFQEGIDEFIPINYNSNYELSFWAKTLVEGTNNLNHAYIDCYDIDGNSIHPQHNALISFQLAQDYNLNQPILKCHDSDKQAIYDIFEKNKGRSVYVYVNSYSYSSETGFIYQNGTYSRVHYNQQRNFNKDISYNVETGEITGLIPLSTTKLIAGDWVSLAMSGGTYIYYIPKLSNHTIPTEWTEYKKVFKASDLLRFGTAFIKIGWLCNRGTISGSTRNKVAFSAINLREV